MRYFIYENWRAEKKCVIHCGSCSACNDGAGVHPNSTVKNGCWHGPFDSFDEADAFAHTQKERVVKYCKRCSPNNK